MPTLEEILNLITSDLELNDQDKTEFIKLFMQLVVYNILLEIPEQYKEGVGEIMNNVPSDQNQIVSKLSSLGIDKDQANQIIDNSIKKSVTETVEKYTDIITSDTKQKLQDYI